MAVLGLVRGERLAQLADVQPVHVAAFLKEMQGEVSTPTVRQHLAAKGPLFRTSIDRSGKALTRNALYQQDAYRTIGRRALAAGIKTEIGCHTFRPTGITTYFKNGGKLEIAQQMANHESARATGHYDRRNDDVHLDEVERIVI